MRIVFWLASGLGESEYEPYSWVTRQGGTGAECDMGIHISSDGQTC